ncbi:MAG: hypothetical protein K5839_04330 [Treponemataceae bacterium]|nr:hypothetical protein [Treponemataceae bacterium]
MMKKIFLLLFIMLTLTSLSFSQEKNSSINLNYKYQKEKHFIAAKLKDKIFSASVFTQIYPYPQLTSWAIKQTSKDFIFQAGNLTFSGSKNKLSNPSWTSIDVLHQNKTSFIHNQASNPQNISSSPDFSTFLKYSLNTKNSLDFRPSLSAIWIPSFKTEDENIIDTSLLFTGLELPFKLGKSMKLQFAASYALNYLENTQSSWFLKNPAFLSDKYSFIQEEIHFENSFLQFYSVFGQCQNPFSSFKLYNRDELTVKIKFNSLFTWIIESRLFLCQNDLFSLSNKIIREPLQYCILPKFVFNAKSCRINLAFLFDSKYSYSDGMEKISCIKNFSQAGLDLEFLTWTFQAKYKYLWENLSGNFSDSHEVCASLWAEIFRTSLMKLSLSSSGKINKEEWLVNAGLKYKIKDFSAHCTISFSGELTDENWELESKISLYYKNMNFGGQIKKATSSQEVAFNISASYMVRF